MKLPLSSPMKSSESNYQRGQYYMVSDAAEKKRAIDDKDLDAYLLGEIDSGNYSFPLPISRR